MSKNTGKKSNIKNSRVYFISSDAEEDLKKIEGYFNDNKKPLFIDKIFKTKSISKDITNIFINIKLNTDLNEDIFKKIADKFNKILNKKYKIFYIDNNNKFVSIPNDIINNINDSLNLFIIDE